MYSSMGDPKLTVQINCLKFSWEAKDHYHEWGAFHMDYQNIFEETYSAMDKAERLAIVLTWMGQDTLKIIQTLHDDGKKRLKKGCYRAVCILQNQV